MNSGSNKSKEPMQDVSAISLRPKTKRAMDVHGGRIVRAAGRKDRHSKVCTARGPRDRRVRLSPNTAIQFYDVQDRLGYDRPSKAIDWLMKEAKAAIDALDDGDNARAFENGLKFEHGQVQSHEYLNGIPFGNCSSFSVDNGQFLAYPNGSNGQEQSLMMIPDSFQRLLGWNSNSSNNLEDSDLPDVHYPSIPISHYDENQLHHLQREPLQSSTTFFPSQFSDGHHHGKFSGEIQDLEDQVLASKPFSSNSLLHYQKN